MKKRYVYIVGNQSTGEGALGRNAPFLGVHGNLLKARKHFESCVAYRTRGVMGQNGNAAILWQIGPEGKSPHTEIEMDMARTLIQLEFEGKRVMEEVWLKKVRVS